MKTNLFKKGWVIIPVGIAYFIVSKLTPSILEHRSYRIIGVLIALIIAFLCVYIYAIFMALLSKRGKRKDDNSNNHETKP